LAGETHFGVKAERDSRIDFLDSPKVKGVPDMQFPRPSSA
jgi:hypothetical protein